MASSVRYPVPAAVHRVTDVVKGSRFVATAARAADVETAKSVIEGIRREFRDATHHCFAYVVGAPGDSRRAGSSDGGEPAGTAGVPMLTVLLNCAVGDIVVVVTRYFGGTKLGRGGLVRAYAGSVKHVMRELELVERVEFVEMRIEVGLPAVDTVRRLVSLHGGAIDAEEFGQGAAFTVRIPEERVSPFEEAVAEATGGRGRVRRTGKSGE